MGGLQATGIRPGTDRTGLARLDVISCRQAADGRCAAEDWAEELGDTGA